MWQDPLATLICEGIVMEKEYVFHGSPIRVDKLIPNQACDIEYKEGCQYAVYATTNKIMAKNVRLLMIWIVPII